MRRDVPEERPAVLRASAIMVFLIVPAVLGGLASACLGGTSEVTPTRGGVWPPPPRRADQGVVTDSAEVVVELRVWQRIDDPLDVWLSAHPKGEETPDPIRFPLDEGGSAGAAIRQFHSFRDLAVGVAELRVWQRYRAPEVIHARACVTPCPDEGIWFAETDLRPGVQPWEYWPWQSPFWSPLGMIAVPLDDGEDEFNGARYRYGNVTVAVAVGNPGLAADREYLLALRDALAGAERLNWSAATPTSEWEGVRLNGWPRRVVGLDLADRGLDGEIWGWLGDLNELMELRLDGNRLTGTVPTKLAMLSKLTHVGLAGNELAGCVPPSLRDVPYHDLARLGLPDCDPPVIVFEDSRSAEHERTQPGSTTYGLSLQDGDYLGFDLPGGRKLTMYLQAYPFEEDDIDGFTECPPCHFEHVIALSAGLVVGAGQGNWLLLDEWSAIEIGRSHYKEDAPALFALFEQVAASVWRNRSGGDNRSEWVWP
jgi:hypothetical protein